MTCNNFQKKYPKERAHGSTIREEKHSIAVRERRYKVRFQFQSYDLLLLLINSIVGIIL